MASTVVYHGYTNNTLGSTGLLDLRVVNPGRIVGIRITGYIGMDSGSGNIAAGLVNVLLNGATSDSPATNDPVRSIILASAGFACGQSTASRLAETIETGYIALSKPTKTGDRITLNSTSGGTPDYYFLMVDVYVMEGSA